MTVTQSLRGGRKPPVVIQASPTRQWTDLRARPYGLCSGQSTTKRVPTRLLLPMISRGITPAMRKGCISVSRVPGGQRYMVERLDFIRNTEAIRELLLIPPDMILYLDRR